MTRYSATIDCPCCENEVVVLYIPGEEPVYYPNELAHPGSLPDLDDIEGCECWETFQHVQKIRLGLRDVSGHEWYVYKVFDRIREEVGSL